MKRNSKRKSPKNRNRNSNRRNCRYSGSLSRFERPYCNKGWDYVDDEELFKQGKILEKLGPHEKFCQNPKVPDYLIIKNDINPESYETFLFDKPRYRNGLDAKGYREDGYNVSGYDVMLSKFMNGE